MEEPKEPSIIEDAILESRNLVKNWKNKAAEAKTPGEQAMFLDFAKEAETHLAEHIEELRITNDALNKNKTIPPPTNSPSAKPGQAKKTETKQLAGLPEEKLLTTGK